MQAVTHTNHSPLATRVAPISLPPIDAVIEGAAADVDARTNAAATEAAAASPDARLDRAYAKLKAQLSRLANFEHRKAAHISSCIGAVEAVADSLTRHADEANEDDKEMHRRLKSGAGYSRRPSFDNDVPALGCNTNKAVYGGGR